MTYICSQRTSSHNAETHAETETHLSPRVDSLTGPDPDRDSWLPKAPVGMHPAIGPQNPTQCGGRDVKSNLWNAQPGFKPTSLELDD